MPSAPRTHATTPPPIKLGFLPLLDSAPLIIAQTQGLFADEGLTVDLEREVSWATLREKVIFGLLDGAHMLAPLPIASTLGLGSVRKPMLTALSLGLNGNSITLSTALYDSLLSDDDSERPTPLALATALKRHLVNHRRHRPLTLATVFPFSMHYYELRHWLSSGGIDPDRDLSLVVIPPAMMVCALSSGEIDGFCVGEPYNAQAVEAGIGRIALTGHDVWSQAPEKVFGVTRDWAERHPETHQGLLRALIRACKWLDQPDNRSGLANILATSEYLDLPTETLSTAVAQMSDDQGPDLPCTHKLFYQQGGTIPALSRARWIAGQMLASGQIADPLPDALLGDIFRTDLYDQAATTLGLPASDEIETAPGP